MIMNEIVTERLTLKPINSEFADEVFDLLSNDEIIYNLNMKKHETIDDSKALIDEYLEGVELNSKIPYIMFEKSTNDFVGVVLIKLDLYNADSYEFTIYMRKEHWDKKFFTEVVNPLKRIAFEDLHTGNFRGYVMKRNIASWKVLEKTGFTLEKTFTVDGLPDEIKSYLITKEEYKKSIING